MLALINKSSRPSLQADEQLGTSGRLVRIGRGAGVIAILRVCCRRCPWSHGLGPKMLYTSVAVTSSPVRVPTQRPLVPSFLSVVGQAENFSACLLLDVNYKIHITLALTLLLRGLQQWSMFLIDGGEENAFQQRNHSGYTHTMRTLLWDDYFKIHTTPALTLQMNIFNIEYVHLG